MRHQSGDGPSLDLYRQMGIAALLPGARLVLEKMQSMVAELERELSLLQNGGGGPKLGRPRKVADEIPLDVQGRPNSAVTYWSKLSKEERQEEYQRRNAKRMATMEARGIKPGRKNPLPTVTIAPAKSTYKSRAKIPGLHPRSPAHPDHAEWLRKVNPATRPNNPIIHRKASK